MAFALDLPGATGHGVTCPDSAALDVTGDLIVWGRYAADDWTPAVVQMFVAKQIGGAAADTAYVLYLATNGTLHLSWSTGAAAPDRASTSATGVTDGAWKYVLGWLDVDNGAAGHDVRFYLSDDAVTWTQLGTTVTTAGVTSIQATTHVLAVGSRSTGAASPFPFAGLVGQAEVRSGGSISGGTLSGGTVVASPSFDRYFARPGDFLLSGVGGTNSFTDAQGNLWTINGGDSKLVTV